MFECLTVSFAWVCSLSNTHAMYTHSSHAQSMLYKFLRRLAEKECCHGNGTILARTSKIGKKIDSYSVTLYTDKKEKNCFSYIRNSEGIG
jgi:hypothetical protein